MTSSLDFSKPLVVLAPLAGYTDLPFRSVVKKFGAHLTISEMISSNALVYNNQKTLKMMQKAQNEQPYFVQLSGNNPDIISKAVSFINQLDWVDGIDLNSGCPAPKVFNHGSGSSLLGDLDRLVKILGAIKKTSTKQYTTIKVRIGVDKKIPLDIAKACVDGGADIISVHGRTKSGAYKAPVDYDAIATITDYAHKYNVKVIANGDIKDREKAKYVLKHTKADGVMIGRGAIGKPWIFYEIIHDKTIDDNTKKDIILEHLKQMVSFYDQYGVVMFRKHLHTYSKNKPNSHEFREIVNKTTSSQEMEQLIKEFF